MMISFSKKFIFIHNPKVAGTSIRRALTKYQPLYRNIFTKNFKLYNFFLINIIKNLPENSKNDHLKSLQITSHSSILEIKENLSEDLVNEFFKFGFVRNPWELEVSRYSYILSSPKHRVHKTVKNLKNFDEYLEWRCSEYKYQQKDLFVDENNKIIVDYIGKFENLNEDFNFVLNKLNLPVVELPHTNKTNHLNYRDFYNDHTKQLIEENFKEDIELFNYEF